MGDDLGRVVGDDLGRVAYEAWSASHKSHHDCQITGWDDLKDEDRADWQRAALAVVAKLPPYGWSNG